MNAAGKKEAFTETYQPDAGDFSDLVFRMKASGIDVVYIGGSYPDVARIAREMRDQAMTTTIVAGDALMTEEYWKAAGDAAEGTRVTFPPDRARTRTRRPSSANSGPAALNRRDMCSIPTRRYDLVQSGAAAGSTAFDAVVQALSKGRFKSVLGEVSFDEKGDANLPASSSTSGKTAVTTICKCSRRPWTRAATSSPTLPASASATPTTPRSSRASPPSSATNRRLRPSTSWAARRAPAKPTCWRRRTRSRRPTQSSWPAVRPSVSTPRPASPPPSPQPGAATRSGRPGCRSCRRRSCSISSTAATRRGATPPTRLSAGPPTPPPARPSPSAPLARAPGRPRPTSRAVSARLGASCRRRHRRRPRRRQRRRPGNDRRRGPFPGRAFEEGGEFGGLGLPATLQKGQRPRHQAQARLGESTTIGVVATDAPLTKAQAKRLAVMAHDGFARALWPSPHRSTATLIFALATGRAAAAPPIGMIAIGSAAAACMARAIARGVYEATPAPGDLVPTWRQRFGR